MRVNLHPSSLCPRFPLFFVFVLLPTVLMGHATRENYIFLNVPEHAIEGYFEIRLPDLEQRFDLVFPEETDAIESYVAENAPMVQQYIRDHFSIGPVGNPLKLEFTETGYEATSSELSFALYYFRMPVQPIPKQLEIKNTLFLENDRLHRSLVLLEYNSVTGETFPPEWTALIFSRSKDTQILDLTNVPGIYAPRDMISQGILHIFIGPDHILFLLVLLLPTVVILSVGKLEPIQRFPMALWNVFKIVTVFTIAHSVTLALAALDYITLPSRLVESIIALSIIVVSANNIYGKDRFSSLWVVLILGLFHGMGFASVMGDLPFRAVELWKVVIGFNIGVELGQMAIVAVVFPILFLVRKQNFYRPFILTGCSSLLGLVALYWFIQRAFDLG